MDGKSLSVKDDLGWNVEDSTENTSNQWSSKDNYNIFFNIFKMSTANTFPG